MAIFEWRIMGKEFAERGFAIEGLVRAVGTSVLILALGACASLPDVKPFASATLELEKSVDESFAASAKAQRHMAQLLTVDPTHPLAGALAPRKKTYEDLATSIETDGVQRNKLMRALTDYTDSLAAIVESSANAQTKVDELANSVVELSGSISASPLPVVAGPAVDLAKVALREAIKIKAAHDLRGGLEVADPVVQKAAEILMADARDLKKSIATKEEAVQAAMNLSGGDPLKYRERLIARRAALIKKLAPSDNADVESQPESEDLQKVEQQIAACDAWYLPLAERRDKALGDLRATEKLYARIEEAIGQWAKAHSDLVIAVRDGRTINQRRLVEVIMEIRGLVKQIDKELGDAKQ